ncbi:MAG TPA: peptidase M61, partial [Chromatiales bacterium]|nr:peptidase M61 [Chromatiales bacterium]
MTEEKPSPEIVYQLKLADPGRHLLDVLCRVDQPDPDGQVFSLPAWIPGSYLIRDYARHVLSVEATTDSGPLGVRKLDKSTWMADPTDGPVVIKSTVYAHDLSVRGAYANHGHTFVNGVCVFFRVHGQDKAPCVVHIDPPERPPMSQWQLATALKRLSGPDLGFGAFSAEDYDALIDRPVLMGPLTVRAFEVDGVAHRLVLVGRVDA